jgi:hypothetical protein
MKAALVVEKAALVVENDPVADAGFASRPSG